MNRLVAAVLTLLIFSLPLYTNASLWSTIKGWFGGEDSTYVAPAVPAPEPTPEPEVLEEDVSVTPPAPVYTPPVTPTPPSAGVSFATGVTLQQLTDAINKLRKELEPQIDLAMESPRRNDRADDNTLRIEDGPDGYILTSTGNSIQWTAPDSLGVTLNDSFSTTSADYWLTQQSLTDAEVGNDITVESSQKIATDDCVRVGNKSSSTGAESICYDSTYGLFEDVNDNGTLDSTESPLGKYIGTAASGATQGIAQSTYVVMTLENETWDVAGWHDTVTNNSRITVDRSGYYRAEWKIAWVNNNGAYEAAFVGVNCGGVQANCEGSTFPSSVAGNHSATNGNLSPIGAGTVYLNAGDYIELFGYNNNGTTRSGLPYLVLSWVGY